MWKYVYRSNVAEKTCFPRNQRLHIFTRLYYQLYCYNFIYDLLTFRPSNILRVSYSIQKRIWDHMFLNGIINASMDNILYLACNLILLSQKLFYKKYAKSVFACNRYTAWYNSTNPKLNWMQKLFIVFCYFWAICAIVGYIESTCIHHAPVSLSANKIIWIVGISMIFIFTYFV